MKKVIKQVPVTGPEVELPADAVVLGAAYKISMPEESDDVKIEVLLHVVMQDDWDAKAARAARSVVSRRVHLVKVGEEVSELAMAAEFVDVLAFAASSAESLAVFVETQKQALDRKPVHGR